MRAILLTLLLVSPAIAQAGDPMISPIPDQWIDPNGSTPVLTVRISDDETPADELTLTAQSNNPAVIPDGNIDLGGSGSNRTVQVTAGEQWGTAVIQITATDPDRDVGQESFTVEVNQPPQ